MKTVIKFQVTKSDGGFTAAAIEYAIYDHALTLGMLRVNVQAALALQCEEMNEDVNQYEVVFEYDAYSI